jgi:Zn-dependent membrane protease YugP
LPWFFSVYLPVEFDASRRALALLVAFNVTRPDEYAFAKKALFWGL